jgi:hypothetical protein
MGSKHLNPVGVNHEAVRMSLRTVHDFDNPKKLDNPLKPLPLTKTKYEAYTKGD